VEIMAISGHIKPAHNFVPEYQQSGIPFIYTFEVEVEEENRVLDNDNIDDYKIIFDQVTRWLIFHCHDTAKSNCRIYFSKTAALTAYNDDADMHYYRVDAEETTPRLELKSKFVYLIPDDRKKAMEVSIIAGLTNIRPDDFPDQTAANGFTGIED
jgi:hypothetical protein